MQSTAGGQVAKELVEQLAVQSFQDHARDMHSFIGIADIRAT